MFEVLSCIDGVWFNPHAPILVVSPKANNIAWNVTFLPPAVLKYKYTKQQLEKLISQTANRAVIFEHPYIIYDSTIVLETPSWVHVNVLNPLHLPLPESAQWHCVKLHQNRPCGATQTYNQSVCLRFPTMNEPTIISIYHDH